LAAKQQAEPFVATVWVKLPNCHGHIELATHRQTRLIQNRRRAGQHTNSVFLVCYPRAVTTIRPIFDDNPFLDRRREEIQLLRTNRVSAKLTGKHKEDRGH